MYVVSQPTNAWIACVSQRFCCITRYLRRCFARASIRLAAAGNKSSNALCFLNKFHVVPILIMQQNGDTKQRNSYPVIIKAPHQTIVPRSKKFSLSPELPYKYLSTHSSASFFGALRSTGLDQAASPYSTVYSPLCIHAWAPFHQFRHFQKIELSKCTSTGFQIGNVLCFGATRAMPIWFVWGRVWCGTGLIATLFSRTGNSPNEDRRSPPLIDIASLTDIVSWHHHQRKHRPIFQN